MLQLVQPENVIRTLNGFRAFVTLFIDSAVLWIPDPKTDDLMLVYSIVTSRSILIPEIRVVGSRDVIGLNFYH